MTDNSRVAAFFDVDGTIVASNIVHYGVEIRTAHLSGAARLAWVAGFLPRVAYYLALDAVSREAFQRAFYKVYRGLGWGDFSNRAQALFHDYVTPRILPAAAARIADHRRRGHRVVLVTGSIESIVEPIAAHLGVSDFLCARLEVRNGVISGELAAPPLAGERKAKAAREWAQRESINLTESYGYADSKDDIPLLECVGRPTVVNPNRALRRTALRHDWDIAEWNTGDDA